MNGCVPGLASHRLLLLYSIFPRPLPSLPLFFVASIFARSEFERWNYFIQTITFVRGSGGGGEGALPVVGFLSSFFLRFLVIWKRMIFEKSIAFDRVFPVKTSALGNLHCATDFSVITEPFSSTSIVNIPSTPH